MVDHSNLKTFFVGMGFVRDYVFQNLDTNIIVMTMPDLHNFQVKRSRHNVHYVYVQHSLVSLHMVYRHGAFDHYDTICAAGPHHVKEIRAIEAKYNLPRKNVIELGYSRLDSLIKTEKKFQKSESIKNKTHKTILVAPSWGSKGVIESGLGKTLVEQLLNLEHEVILRPHPQTIKFARAKIDEIRSQHKVNPRFTFEASVAGQESLHKSNIMVSDWSGASLEYAFALNKPVIFCDVLRKVNNTNYKDIEIEPLEVFIREKIGVIWDGLSPVGKLIEHCEQKSKLDLRALTDRHVFNAGRSDDIFYKSIRGYLDQ
jgi:CDP-glycerol glycerophosphotransferase (TagB/SpsB family)